MSICLVASALLPAVDLGHQEDLLPVTVLKRFAHSRFAHAFVVVPAVIHEGDAAIDSLADEANRILLSEPGLPDMPAA